MKKRLTLAIDFDGTIVEEHYPAIGPLLPDAREIINKLYEDGHYIIIWTCRCDNFQHEVAHFLFENKINFHTINANQPERLLKYNMDCRKVSADIYIDDKGILGIPSWKEIYQIVNKKAYQV